MQVSILSLRRSDLIAQERASPSADSDTELTRKNKNQWQFVNTWYGAHLSQVPLRLFLFLHRKTHLLHFFQLFLNYFTAC